MQEQLRVGLDYLESITTLLQRVRNAHPTDGLYQAAEVQFWWGRPRSTDEFGQLFWFDDSGLPAAAFTVTDFGGASSLVYDEPTVVVSVLPDADPDWVAHVISRGLAHVAGGGIDAVEVEIDREDAVMRDEFAKHDFVLQGAGVIECWLDSAARPKISPLPEGYRLVTRRDMTHRVHHMARPELPGFEERLQQTSLYRPALDLLVIDDDDETAAYGMFWFNPVTATGVVEPMRTYDEHQGRGLARHLLTVGIELLAGAGAERISIGFEPGNPVSSHLYTSVGFEPYRQTDVFGGLTNP